MKKTIFALDDREHATVLAALRYWQRLGNDASPEIDIAGSDPLSNSEIDDLCEALNLAEPTRIAVTTEGGLITAIVSDNDDLIGVPILVIDYDTEGVLASETVIVPTAGGGESSDAVVALYSIERAGIDLPHVFGEVGGDER